MIIKQELINKIRDYFGLNIYETKVWLALLGKGIASAGEIASISKVPRSRTYDVLESLEKKGFAITKIGKPVKYIGIKPRTILEKIKNNVRKNAEEKIVSLSRIKETQEFVQLEELYKKGINPIKREDISASLSGKSNITNYLKEILQNAEKEVIICTSAEDVKTKEKLFKQTMIELTKKGIKTKFALFGDDNLIKTLEKRLNTRIIKTEIKSKFFLIDRREILFYLSIDANENDTAIWVNSEFFTQAFASLFDKAVKVK